MSSLDPLLHADNSRFVLFPIKFPDIWNAYKAAQSSFWTTEEIDLTADTGHWANRLTSEERRFFSQILAFFAASDGIVNENLVQRFAAEVQLPEARCFYGFQIMMENIHAETYSLLLLTLVRDPAEQRRLFQSIDTIPSIRAKANWCLEWIENHDMPFAVRLIAFAAVEGIFFSSSFAAIFWLKSRGLMPGLCHSNELISRDEGLHTNFACLLHRHLQQKAPEELVHVLIRQAVVLEQTFFSDALPVPLPGMNAELMSDYVEHIADRLLISLNYKPLYNKPNPFPFIQSIAMDGRTNFFERRVSEYHLGRSADSTDPNSALYVGRSSVIESPRLTHNQSVPLKNRSEYRHLARFATTLRPTFPI
ncbi:putative ribonucleoside-diphosphate reductase small chain B [Trametes cingulata]|nr:putative ribonucleoside-diphosphate reductase small chain B [Trametes cingulata]